MLEFGEKLSNIHYIERPGAYAVVSNVNSEIAVLKNSFGFYLPGGGIEFDETFESALQREILEELGSESRISSKFATACQYLFGRMDNLYYKKIGHFFVAELGLKVCDPTDTGQELVWVSRLEAIEMLTHEYQAWAVKQYLELEFATRSY